MRAAQKRSEEQPPCPAISTPSRSATWKASWRACRSPRPRADRAARRRGTAARRRRSRAVPTPRICARRIACSRPAASSPSRRSSSASCTRFDGYERLKAQAANNEYPKPPDNFRWRFFGLFYVAPNQNSYMCRLRMPNGILDALAIRRRRRSRRALRRRLCPRHHPRQSAGARDRGEERRRHGRGDPGPRARARAAPAPTTSATSPARRPPASIRRS